MILDNPFFFTLVLGFVGLKGQFLLQQEVSLEGNNLIGRKPSFTS